MVETRTVFRCLVLTSFSANMVWTFFRDVYWESFDENTQSLLRIDGYGSIVPGAEYLFWAVLAVSFICYTGLVSLNRWAIWLLLFIDISILIFLAPFSGIEISAPIERITKTIFLMSDGAIIALAFFSDLKKQFK